MSETFHRLPIVSVRRLNDTAVEVTFAVPEANAAALKFKPGQHVAVRATIGGIEQQRTYSMCSGRGGPFRIGIKHVAGGTFSTWANTHLKTGESLDVGAPQGRFTLPAGTGAPRDILMLAAGAGITPILGMSIDALENEPETRITLVYGNRTLAHAMFLTELEDLKDRYPARFDLLNVLSGRGEAEAELLQGRITGEKLKALTTQRIDLRSFERAFVCGPGSFIKETRNALFELGLTREVVHHEFFIGRTANTTPQPAQRPEIALEEPVVMATGTIDAIAVLDGQRHRFPIAPGQHVLDAALKAGIKAPHSCTGGMCSTCRARLVEGTATMTVNYSLEDWEMKRGFILTCQAVATSHTLVVDYDAM